MYLMIWASRARENLPAEKHKKRQNIIASLNIYLDHST